MNKESQGTGNHPFPPLRLELTRSPRHLRTSDFAMRERMANHGALREHHLSSAVRPPRLENPQGKNLSRSVPGLGAECDLRRATRNVLILLRAASLSPVLQGRGQLPLSTDKAAALTGMNERCAQTGIEQLQKWGVLRHDGASGQYICDVAQLREVLAAQQLLHF